MNHDIDKFPQIVKQALDVLWEAANSCKEENALNILQEYLLDIEEEKPKCVAIVDVYETGWRMDYLSLPVGTHKLYDKRFTFHGSPQTERKL